MRRFKGLGAGTAAADGGEKTYYHYANGTRPRDSEGWQGLRYTSDTMRNDIIKVRVKDDGAFIDMQVVTKDPLTPYTDDAWMRVFIDTDESGVSPNWEGFEYVINRTGASAAEMPVERSLGGWSFERTGTAAYSVQGNTLEIRIPVAALGLSGDTVRFRFKISDNMQTDGDVMDFYLHGDVAPGGRFTFVY